MEQGQVLRVPPDRFIALASSWSRRRTSVASDEHMSWGLSLGSLMVRKSYPVDVRETLGLRHDSWMGLFLLHAESASREFWERDRNACWQWCVETGMNLVMALSAPTSSRAKSFRTFEEIKDHGLSAALEWPMTTSDEDDLRISSFVEKHEIQDIVISRGVTYSKYKDYQARRMMRLKELSKMFPPGCRVYIFGASSPTLSARSIAHFKGFEIYLGGSRVWQDAGRWILPPRQPVPKTTWSQERCLAEGLKRWRKWSTVFADSRKTNGPN
jgi:hypothetical protein